MIFNQKMTLANQQPPQLQNLGNTCYMNATLQCIIAIKPLHDYMASAMMENDVQQCTRGTLAEKQLALKFMHFLRKIADRGHVYAPVYLKQTIDECISLFKGQNQHDAHEFLVLFLDAMSRGSCFTVTMVPDHHDDEAFEAWKSEFANKYSVITGAFFGQERSCLTCHSCQKTSKTYASFSSINLDIMQDDSLDHCLANYLQPETVQYTCETCKGTGHTKQVSIQKWPKVLAFTLKRFTSREKKMHDITFGDQSALGGNTYHLCGIVNHHGSGLHHGHYTSHVKTGDRWYLCNDDRISAMSGVPKSSREAYMIFYTRV